MDEMPTLEKREIAITRTINAPVELVWEVLSKPEHLAQWWAPGNIEPTVGHRFSLDMKKWGQVPCEILEAVPFERLVYTFGDWTLSWRLESDGAGTRLYFEHSGFDLGNPQHKFAFENMGPGWRDTVLPRFSNYVESLALEKEEK